LIPPVKGHDWFIARSLRVVLNRVIKYGGLHMKKMIFASVILFGGLVATAASAMPAVSFEKPASDVIKVDWACGRGLHETPWGGCRPNRWGLPPERAYFHRSWGGGDWGRERHGWRHGDERDWRRDHHRDYYDN
jgi:hypothetical protein